MTQRAGALHFDKKIRKKKNRIERKKEKKAPFKKRLTCLITPNPQFSLEYFEIEVNRSYPVLCAVKHVCTHGGIFVVTPCFA